MARAFRRDSEKLDGMPKNLSTDLCQAAQRPKPVAPNLQSSDNYPMKLLPFAAFAIAAYAQTINYAKIEILTEQYTPNLYMLAGAPGDADPNHPDGAGGRIGLL